LKSIPNVDREVYEKVIGEIRRKPCGRNRIKSEVTYF